VLAIQKNVMEKFIIRIPEAKYGYPQKCGALYIENIKIHCMRKNPANLTL
jgi:hypothetical protein